MIQPLLLVLELHGKSVKALQKLCRIFASFRPSPSGGCRFNRPDAALHGVYADIVTIFLLGFNRITLAFNVMASILAGVLTTLGVSLFSAQFF